MTPSESNTPALRQTVALAAGGHATEAIEQFNKVISVDKLNGEAYCGRGLVRQLIRDHDGAISDFTTAICLAKSDCNASLYYNRAISYYATGHNEEAIRDCSNAIELQPKNGRYRYLRGIVYKAIGCMDEAMAELDLALKGDPTLWEAMLERGKLWVAKAMWSKAIEDFSAVLKLVNGSDAGWALYWRGVSYQEQGNHRDAIADFTRAIENITASGGAYMRRSRSRRELGEIALANEDLETGRRLIREGR